MNGILVIDKEKEYTSRDVVNIVAKKFNTKKVGHTGTLDPLATGVLVLCINDATKLAEILTNHDKEYIAEATLGLLTDTLDITGSVLESKDSVIDRITIKKCLDKFQKKYLQEVPLYSALRISGKRLYNYAFAKEEIELPSREVEIKEIELLDYKIVENKTVFKFRCVVSKGTYIRSLIRDIAQELKTIGVMSNLKRTKQGQFSIESAIKLENLKNDNFKLLSITEILNDYFKVIVDDELKLEIKNGKIIDNIYGKDTVFFVDKSNNPLAIYKMYEKDITKIKPWKMFIKNK